MSVDSVPVIAPELAVAEDVPSVAPFPPPPPLPLFSPLEGPEAPDEASFSEGSESKAALLPLASAAFSTKVVSWSGISSAVVSLASVIRMQNTPAHGFED